MSFMTHFYGCLVAVPATRFCCWCFRYFFFFCHQLFEITQPIVTKLCHMYLWWWPILLKFNQKFLALLKKIWQCRNNARFRLIDVKILGTKPCFQIIGVGTDQKVGRLEARRGCGFGERAASPSPPARGLGERCKLPQRGPGQSPKTNLVHFWRQRTFLVEGKSDIFMQKWYIPKLIWAQFLLNTQSN